MPGWDYIRILIMADGTPREKLEKILRKHRRRNMMLWEAVFFIEQLFQNEEDATERILAAIRSINPFSSISGGLPQDGKKYLAETTDSDGVIHHRVVDLKEISWDGFQSLTQEAVLRIMEIDQ